MNKQDTWLSIGIAAVIAFFVIGYFLSKSLTRRTLHTSTPPVQYTSVLDRLYPFIPSPNYNERPPDETVDCIVLHATGEDTKRGVVEAFLDPHEHKSAHFIVSRDGSVLQMVPVELRAWHAGNSELGGVNEVNDYSIGIGMVNRNNGRERYTKAQYVSVAKLIDQIRMIYTVPNDRIVSHAQIALPPGRKNDPDGFNFQHLFVKMAQVDPDIHSQMTRRIAAAHDQHIALATTTITAQ